MNKNDLILMKKWFENYTASYLKDDFAYNYAINLKKEHTMRVCENITMIGGALNISEHEMLLAETIGLCHDIGRFEQYAVYGTFNDLISENHAKLSIRRIEKHKLLSTCGTHEKQIIIKAIAAHNAAKLPDINDKKQLFFMRLIRDSDKLDIWESMLNYYNERKKNPDKSIIPVPDDPVCSEKILHAMKKRELPGMQDIKTLNDFKLIQLSWVYDLNFLPAFQEVQRRKVIERLAEVLPKTEEVKDVVKLAKDYVKSSIIKSCHRE